MIYVHIPFCHRKCAYCAFYSVARQHVLCGFLDALEAEAAARLPQGMRPRTLYVGGGTPSLLPPEAHGRLKRMLESRVCLGAVQESTVEANPEDLTPDYLHALHALGLYNRVSIGVQSLDDGELRAINRRHTAAQAVRAVQAAAALFPRVSIDLIYGLPGQTADSWQRTLDAAFRLPVTHLSAYALSVEPATLLERQLRQGRATLPAEEAVMQMYAALQQRVKAEGWEQYEISSYCRDGHRSLHNSRYWRHCSYIGLGPAAHSLDMQRRTRRWNLADVDAYIGSRPHEEEHLTEADLYNEWLMLGLRTADGLDEASLPLASMLGSFGKGMSEMERRGWVVRQGGRYRPTPEGLLHADGMASELFIA